jgi:23S rRNA (adenine2503-C2)-methyltransferase
MAGEDAVGTAHLEEAARWRLPAARPLAAHVNLLPLHPGGAPDLTPSPRAQMLAFERRLRGHGIEAVLRRSRGLDISAACGQLRVEVEGQQARRPGGQLAGGHRQPST